MSRDPNESIAVAPIWGEAQIGRGMWPPDKALRRTLNPTIADFALGGPRQWMRGTGPGHTDQ